MVEKVIKIKVEGKDVEVLESDLKKVSQELDNVKGNSENIAKQNKTTSKSFNGMATAVKGVGTALKAAGIGLVIGLFAKLADMVSQNQKVMDFLATTGNAINLVFQDLFSIFENGLPSISEIGESIKNNIIERFNSAIKFAGLVGKAIKKLFEGDFKGALDTAGDAGKEFVDVLTGVDNSLDKITEYTKDIVKQADAFTQLTNNAKLAEAQLRRVFEQSDRDAEIQRRIRDDFNKTFEERFKASEELAKILDKQEKTQLRLAGLEVQRARNAIKFTGDNIDNQVALTNALAEQDAIQADIAGRRAEQEAQDRALRKEFMDARKAEIEQQTVETIEIARKQQEVLGQIQMAALDNTVEIEQRKIDFKREILSQEADILSQFGGLLQQLGEENKTLAIAGIVAEQIASTAKIILATGEANAKAVAASPLTGGQPWVTLNTVSAGLAIASGALAATKAIGQLGGGGGGITNGAGNLRQGGGASAPSFNVVGTSGTNQLAESLQQDQNPIQAYVVGSNITTQQELDRNIVETATLG